MPYMIAIALGSGRKLNAFRDAQRVLELLTWMLFKDAARAGDVLVSAFTRDLSSLNKALDTLSGI